MEPIGRRAKPCAPNGGRGWTYRFGIDLMKAGETGEGSGAALVEYATKK